MPTNAMTLSQSALVLGGRFFTLGGLTRRGLGGVNLNTGALTTWPSTLVIYDYGLNAGFTSLSTDGTSVYGTGYDFGANGGQGNFEGRVAITATGSIVWLDDCHGDSYSAVPIGSVLYSVGHSHNCASVGAYPEKTTPRTRHRAIADTTRVTATLKRRRNPRLPVQLVDLCTGLLIRHRSAAVVRWRSPGARPPGARPPDHSRSPRLGNQRSDRGLVGDLSGEDLGGTATGPDAVSDFTGTGQRGHVVDRHGGGGCCVGRSACGRPGWFDVALLRSSPDA